MKNAVKPFVSAEKGLTAGKAFCDWIAGLPLMDRLGIAASTARLQATKTAWLSRAGVDKVKRGIIPEKRAGARRVIPNQQKKSSHTPLRDRLLVAESYQAWLKARLQEGSEPPLVPGSLSSLN